MSAQTDQDRTEQATPFRLEEARRKGAVPFSREVGPTAAIATALLCLAAFSAWMGHGLLVLERQIFLLAGTAPFDLPRLSTWLSLIAERGLYLLSPLLAFGILAGVLTSLLQSGPVFSTQALKPDFDRINPAAGLRRIFSARTVFEAGKILVKLALVATAAYLVLRPIYASLPQLYRAAPGSFPAVLRHDVIRLLQGMGLVLLLIAVLDVSYTRFEFMRRMRMSRRELRDEVKRREGDPQIRSRRRSAQKELRKRSAALGRVKEADVIITNPTHYAVALKYRRGQAPAPEVIAKGSGSMARAIRELAFRHRVPVVTSPTLARALFRDIQIGSTIAPKHYDGVAAILRRVYAARPSGAPV